MAARGDIVPGAKILNLPEIILRDLVTDCFPEIVFDAGGFSMGAAIEHQQRQQRQEVIAVALLEALRKALLPGEAAVRHRFEEDAHE